MSLPDLKKGSSSNTLDIKAKELLLIMEKTDLELNPKIYTQIELFNIRKDWLDKKIFDGVFFSKCPSEMLFKKGVKAHKRLFHYLENKVIINKSINF
ncbi:hypothetical protein GCM10028791_43540 [Echinicola sediminis]